MEHLILPRRRLLGGLAAGTSGLLLAGCDRLNQSEGFRDLLTRAEGMHLSSQRALAGRGALAREYAPEAMSPVFRANGTRMPEGTAYQGHIASKFANWRLTIDGLVEQPQAFSLAEIRTMPAREQITRHDCVEGWSAIGKWAGPQLALLLDIAGLSRRARFVVFHCADLYGGRPYYESIDLVDAYHPQTILAWRMNDELLPVPHGAPLRLRVERQLGYKHAKYVERIEVRQTLAGLHGGKGGLWEDRADYAWYAGI